MLQTNFILLNMMKHQLLAIYQTYNDHAELLHDTVVKRGYETLVSVKSTDELYDWRKYMNVIGLSYVNSNGIERRQNILGELDDFASMAYRSTLDEFIKWKNTFEPSDWVEIENHSCTLVRKIHALANRDYDVHIMLIRCGSQYIAIGNDADRLFEIFGWQTSTAFDGEKHISFMFVTNYGFEVLKDSKFSLMTMDVVDVGIKNEEFYSDSFTEDMVAEYQQRIDYMRLLARKKDEFKEFMTDTQSFVSPKLGFSALIGSRMSIGPDTVTAVLDDGSEVTIAEGHSWRLDDLGLPYMLSLGVKIGEA